MSRSPYQITHYLETDRRCCPRGRRMELCVGAKMTNRDELAALIRDAMLDGSEDVFMMPGSPPSLREVCVDGWVDFVHVAEVLIAAGWRAPEMPPEKTRTVKDELAGYSRDHLIEVAKLLNPDGLGAQQ